MVKKIPQVSDELMAAASNEAVKEALPSSPEPKAAPVKAAPVKAGAPVNVCNIGRGYLRQPSSGVTVYPKETKPMTDDGWLDNQIRAGLLKKV